MKTAEEWLEKDKYLSTLSYEYEELLAFIRAIQTDAEQQAKICVHSGYQKDCLSCNQAALERAHAQLDAQQAVIPDGYVVVPKEPTEKMMDEANREFNNGSSTYPIYKMMLSAAPPVTLKTEAQVRREALQKLDDKACELYQRDKENGIRDRDSSALDMISAIRALAEKVK